MKPKESDTRKLTGAEIRAEYVAKGIIKPHGKPAESVKCQKCETIFDRLVERKSDVLCSSCKYASKERK